MSDKPISDLRRRLLQDMTNRNFGAKTRHNYIRHIETFAKFLGRAPDTATGDDIRRFQAEQIVQGAQPPKMNTPGILSPSMIVKNAYFIGLFDPSWQKCVRKCVKIYSYSTSRAGFASARRCAGSVLQRALTSLDLSSRRRAEPGWRQPEPASPRRRAAK